MFPLDEIYPHGKDKHKREHLIDMIKRSRKLYKYRKLLKDNMAFCNTCENLINLKLTGGISYCCACTPIPDTNGMLTGHRSNGRYCNRCGADMGYGYDNTLNILREKGLLEEKPEEEKKIPKHFKGFS